MASVQVDTCNVLHARTRFESRKDQPATCAGMCVCVGVFVCDVMKLCEAKLKRVDTVTEVRADAIGSSYASVEPCVCARSEQAWIANLKLCTRCMLTMIYRPVFLLYLCNNPSRPTKAHSILKPPPRQSPDDEQEEIISDLR